MGQMAHSRRKLVSVLTRYRGRNDLISFADCKKRESAILSTLEDLESKAKAVMDIITNPQVFQALKQDKQQNLEFLKSQHGVSGFCVVLCPKLTVCASITATSTRHRLALQARAIPVHCRTIPSRFGLPLPFPRPDCRRRP